LADIVMPQLGETVTEGTITKWLVKVGDKVEIDQPLFEVSTDKVDSEVPSTASGVVTELIAAEGDTVEVGKVVARIGSAGEAPAPLAPQAPAAEAPAPQKKKKKQKNKIK
jgi:pyruvate dehydrogenase E2 component (dihydrolipoamide acetyltransferase)